MPSWSGEYRPQNSPSIVSDDYVGNNLFCHAITEKLIIFVDIQFERKLYVNKINIYETYNPGAVVRIWALNVKDNGNKWALLWEGAPEKFIPRSRIFSPPLKYLNFATRYV